MSESPTVSRRQARRDAMIVLYQRDLTGLGLEELYANLEKDRGYQPASYTRDVVGAVDTASGDIDLIIDSASRAWPAFRMAAIERNILRIAVYEIIKRPDIPVEVSIDEAVALAKRYSSREAGSLVNGILSHIAEEAANDD